MKLLPIMRQATVIFDTDLSWTKEKTGYNYEMIAMIGDPEHYTQLNIGGVYNDNTGENTMGAYVENPMGEVEHWDVKLLEENTVNGYIKISVTVPKSGKYNLSMIHDAINDCDIRVFQHP